MKCLFNNNNEIDNIYPAQFSSYSFLLKHQTPTLIFSDEIIGFFSSTTAVTLPLKHLVVRNNIKVDTLPIIARTHTHTHAHLQRQIQLRWATLVRCAFSFEVVVHVILQSIYSCYTYHHTFITKTSKRWTNEVKTPTHNVGCSERIKTCCKLVVPIWYHVGSGYCLFCLLIFTTAIKSRSCQIMFMLVSRNFVLK